MEEESPDIIPADHPVEEPNYDSEEDEEDFIELESPKILMMILSS